MRQAGSSVALRDYDAQGSASKALKTIGITEQPKAPDILLFDTPPNLTSPATDTAAREAHTILIPTSPSPFDLWEAGESAEFAKKRNNRARVMIVLNRVKPGTLLGVQSKEYLQGLGVSVLPVTLGDRQGYQRAALDGWQALDTAAREELLGLSLAVTNLR